jgi:hypothetical protein
MKSAGEVFNVMVETYWYFPKCENEGVIGGW